jgi:hypothetical protein
MYMHGNAFLDKINYSINQSYLFFDGKYGIGMMAHESGNIATF